MKIEVDKDKETKKHKKGHHHSHHPSKDLMKEVEDSMGHGIKDLYLKSQLSGEQLSRLKMKKVLERRAKTVMNSISVEHIPACRRKYN